MRRSAVCQQSCETPLVNYHLKLPNLNQEEESMEAHLEGVAFRPIAQERRRGRCLRAGLVRQMVARRERREGTRQIAGVGGGSEDGGFANERLAVLLDGYECAFRYFGGVTPRLDCLYDNSRTLLLGRCENKVPWHPLFENFARYYGFTPSACQPYRSRTIIEGRVASRVISAAEAS
jgi:hypothetical protein